MKNVEHNFWHNLRVDTQKHNAQTFQRNLSDHTLSTGRRVRNSRQLQYLPVSIILSHM